MINRKFYLKLYSDVKFAKVDPVSHFENFGINEIRIPNYSSYYVLDHDLKIVISSILKNNVVNYKKNVVNHSLYKFLGSFSILEKVLNFLSLFVLFLKLKKNFSCLSLCITEELSGGVNRFLSNQLLLDSKEKNYIFLVPDKFSTSKNCYFKFIYQFQGKTYIRFYSSFMVNLFFILIKFFSFRFNLIIHHYNFDKFPNFYTLRLGILDYNMYIHDFLYFDKKIIYDYLNLNKYSTFSGFHDSKLSKRSQAISTFIRNASIIFVPSVFVRDVLVNLEICVSNKIEIYPPPFKKLQLAETTKVSPIITNIAFFGSFQVSKGSEILLRLNSFLNEIATDKELLIFGKSEDNFFRTNSLKYQKVRFMGEYCLDDIPNILNRQNIDCIILPSQDPETFSFVFHELFHPSLTYFVSNLGIFTNEYDIPRNENIFKVNRYWDINSWEQTLSKHYFKL